MKFLSGLDPSPPRKPFRAQRFSNVTFDQSVLSSGNVDPDQIGLRSPLLSERLRRVELATNQGSSDLFLSFLGVRSPDLPRTRSAHLRTNIFSLRRIGVAFGPLALRLYALFANAIVPSSCCYLQRLSANASALSVRHSPDRRQHRMLVPFGDDYAAQKKMADEVFPRRQERDIASIVGAAHGLWKDVVSFVDSIFSPSPDRRVNDPPVPSRVFAVVEHTPIYGKVGT